MLCPLVSRVKRRTVHPHDRFEPFDMQSTYPVFTGVANFFVAIGRAIGYVHPSTIQPPPDEDAPW
jgi:hypothetical protein